MQFLKNNQPSTMNVYVMVGEAVVGASDQLGGSLGWDSVSSNVYIVMSIWKRKRMRS